MWNVQVKCCSKVVNVSNRENNGIVHSLINKKVDKMSAVNEFLYVMANLS